LSHENIIKKLPKLRIVEGKKLIQELVTQRLELKSIVLNWAFCVKKYATSRSEIYALHDKYFLNINSIKLEGRSRGSVKSFEILPTFATTKLISIWSNEGTLLSIARY
jgi:hypothetical protein